MKIIYVLMLTLLLASCGGSDKVENNNNIVDEIVIEETTNQIDEELNNLEMNIDSDISNELLKTNEVIKIDAKYNNPKWEVDMLVSYVLDSNWIIESMDISASNFDLSNFNSEAQILIWKTIDDAKQFEVAGGSLTTEAFRNALK